MVSQLPGVCVRVLGWTDICPGCVLPSSRGLPEAPDSTQPSLEHATIEKYMAEFKDTFSYRRFDILFTLVHM